ncbi:MAG: response regulator, partial [Pseudomonadota bacterium]
MLDATQENTLLIVEDDDALRNQLARAMERRGYSVLVASGLSEAMDQADAGLPRYAIVDLRLQDGSGLSLVETLEKRDPDIRAIILTGYGSIPTAVAAARIGAIDYIAKPATAKARAPDTSVPLGRRTWNRRIATSTSRPGPSCA